MLKKSPITVTRQDIRLDPNDSRVITKFFTPKSEERISNILERIFLLPEDLAKEIFEETVKNFEGRHTNIRRIFKDNYDKISREYEIKPEPSLEKKLLIGSYFTMEYSIESAALFNPSIIPHPDQSILKKGKLRVIISFRAVGEGHISSIVFHKGIVKPNGDVTIDYHSALVEQGRMLTSLTYQKENFVLKLKELNCYNKIKAVLEDLLDEFTYTELNHSINKYKRKYRDRVTEECEKAIRTLLWLAQSTYEIKFSKDLSLSGRVIFPISQSEIKGLEDARFVLFIDEKGGKKYYATYTAYNGYTILPQLIETTDFRTFRMTTLIGDGVKGKGMALFPKKINGKYIMISRNDNENIYIMFSDNIHFWNDPILLKPPAFYWEFFQIGNSGSPLETEKGWLLLTHGVGPVRTYSIGVILLDLEDPTKIIGVLKDPLIVTQEDERNGYVPNVVYSCGAIIHNRNLIIPYAMSDSRSGIATVDLDELFQHMVYYY